MDNEFSKLSLIKFFQTVVGNPDIYFKENDEIWDVLTALRGPDLKENDDDKSMKIEVTEKIRGVLIYMIGDTRWCRGNANTPSFKNKAISYVEEVLKYCLDMISKLENSDPPKTILNEGRLHFLYHSYQAAEVLGGWLMRYKDASTDQEGVEAGT